MLPRRLSWGYQPAQRRMFADGVVYVRRPLEDDVDVEAQAGCCCRRAPGPLWRWTQQILDILDAVANPALGWQEDTFPEEDKESEFHESWRDENRGVVLWNLGAFIVGYAILAALSAASVFVSDPGSSMVRYDNPALTSAHAATTEALVGAGFSTLALAFVALASAPQMGPRLLETVKALTVLAVVGCVAAADTAGGVSGGDHEQPELFVSTVAMLCCLPALLMSSPAATVRSASLVAAVYLAGAVCSASARVSFASRGAPRVLLLCAAAW